MPSSKTDPLEPAPTVIIERIVQVPQQAEVTRICSYCLTRMPVRAMHQQADSLVCDEPVACMARAREKQLYPVTEDETAIAGWQLQQGAVRRSPQEDELDQLRRDRSADVREVTEITA
jgi:hypothetical protein